MNTDLTNEGVEKMPIGEQEIRKARSVWQKYKDSKKDLDERLKNNEQFWKMRHLQHVGDGEQHRPTGWLLNAIHSKHADMMDGYPEPSIRAKESTDVKEAKLLSEIVPVVLETSGFRKVYDKECRDKINKGTGVYGIYWDTLKNFGKGDISIVDVNLLNLYYEPEITDIQKSRNVFLLTEANKEDIEQIYPHAKGKVKSGSATTIERYENEENVDHTDKCVVFDWYYKKWQNGKQVLHYCKFVDDVVLYSSENDTKRPTMQVQDVNGQPVFDELGNPVTEEIDVSVAEKGWYEHGQYPFVLDPMFPNESSPCGYGYTDLFRGTQDNIDELKHDLLKIASIYANPKWFYKADMGINLNDLTDPDKQFIPCEGQIDLQQFTPPQVPDLVFQFMQSEVEELKEVTGNRDVNNGSTSSGVTAASAIAALQEHAGKLSRHAIQNTYERVKEITYQVVELIRQFYTVERQFRIVGPDGAEYYTNYSNENIRPQSMGNDFGNNFGDRLPQFDVLVSAAKATGYSRLSQNEFALQLYGAGVFQPQNADVVLPMLQLMDFDDKDKVVQSVQQNSMLFKQNQMLMQTALGLAQKYEPQTAMQIAAMVQGAGAPQQMPAGQVDAEMTQTNSDGTLKAEEHAFVEKARERTQASTQPR